MAAVLERHRWVRNVMLLVGAAAVTLVATREVLHHASGKKLVLVVAAAVVLFSAILRWLSAAPALIVLATAVAPYPVSFVGKTPFGVVTVAGALAFSLVVVVAYLSDSSGRTLPPEPGLRILLVWVAWSVVSAAASSFPKVALNEARQVLFALPLAYLAGRAIAARRPLVLRWCLMSVTAIAAFAVVQAVTGFAPVHLIGHHHFPLVDPGESYRYGRVRVRVGYYHASDLGRVLAVALPFMVVDGLRKEAEVWARVGLVLVVVALALTVTFTDWVAAAVGLGILVIASPVTRQRAVVAGAAILVALALGAGGSVTHLASSRLHPNGSALAEQNLRLALVPAAIGYADSHRLTGSGPGTFNQVHLVRPLGGHYTVLVDDSTFATRLIEEGYPGLVLFSVGLLALGVGFWKRRHLPYGPAVLAGFAAWVVAAVTVDALVRDAPLLATWLLLGTGAGAGMARRPAARLVPSGSWQRVQRPQEAAAFSTAAVLAAASDHR